MYNVINIRRGIGFANLVVTDNPTPRRPVLFSCHDQSIAEAWVLDEHRRLEKRLKNLKWGGLALALILLTTTDFVGWVTGV